MHSSRARVSGPPSSKPGPISVALLCLLPPNHLNSKKKIVPHSGGSVSQSSGRLTEFHAHAWYLSFVFVSGAARHSCTTRTSVVPGGYVRAVFLSILFSADTKCLSKTYARNSKDGNGSRVLEHQLHQAATTLGGMAATLEEGRVRRRRVRERGVSGRRGR